MKKGSLVAAAVVAVLGGLGWLAWTLLLATPHDAATPAASATHAAAPSVSAAAPVVEAAQPEDATPTRAAESIAPPPAALIDAEMPASYRKALSGVRGRLVEEDGKPIPGLEVELLEVRPSAMLGDYAAVFAGVPPKFPDLSVAKSKSAEDGTFTLHGTHGHSPHGLGIDLGGARGTVRVIDRSLASGEVTDLGDVVLGAFVTFRGKIEDEDGKPVAGARVRAAALPSIAFQPGVADVGRAAGVMNRGGMGAEVIEFPATLRAWESKLPIPTTKSGDDGSFELKGVPQGAVTMIADRDGFAGVFKGPTTTGKRDRDIGTITLAKGQSLHGVAVDAAGHPLAGATIFGGITIPGTPLTILFPTAPTGADGRFEVAHLSENANSLCIAARANPLQPITVVSVDDPGHDVTVVLPGSCSLDVMLKKKDGSVVADAELWLNPTPFNPILSFAAPQRVPAAQIEKVADGHLRVKGLGAGHCELFGRAAGLARTSIECEVTADPKEVTLEFAPATTLSVQVVDAATKLPIEWAEVSATPDAKHEAPLIARRTDATGLAQLPELPAVNDPRLRIHVAHPAYAPQMRSLAIAGATGAPEVFELAPGATLHGHVHSGGAPLPEPVLFTLEFRDRTREIDDSFPRLAVPGLDGTFELKGLPPGRATWEVIPRAFGGDPTKSIDKIASIRRIRGGSIDLKEGETAELDVDVDPRMGDTPAKISGVIHVRGTKRPAKMKLHVNSQELGGGREQKQQDFEVRPEERFTYELAAGWINLSLMDASSGDGRNSSQTLYQTWFQLDPGQTQDITTDLEFVHASIKVVDDAGQPAPHAGVSISEVRSGDNTTPTSLWNQSGDDGAIELDLPRPGRWRFMVNSNTAGRANAEFDFPSSRTERIVLARGVPCAGRVEIDNDPGGDQTYWLSIQQRTENGGIDYVGGQQLEQGTRTFEVVGLAPGKYSVGLSGQRWSREWQELELPAAGRRDFVLHFKLSDPPPTEKK